MKSRTQQLAVTGAIFAALGMLLLSLAESLGFYHGAVTMMTQWHMVYDATSIIGIIGGIIEAMIITYVSILIVVWIYDALGSTK